LTQAAEDFFPRFKPGPAGARAKCRTFHRRKSTAKRKPASCRGRAVAGVGDGQQFRPMLTSDQESHAPSMESPQSSRIPRRVRRSFTIKNR
jgi:hypothetical protein